MGLTPETVCARRYAVWLIPSSPAYADLKRRIKELSLKYSTPCFEPHVTLIGLAQAETLSDAQATELVEPLARVLKPHAMILRHIEHKDEYYKSIYAKVELSPEATAAGEEGRRFYRQIFNEEPADYFPHMSLFYGDMTIEQIERIIAEDFSGRREFNMSVRIETLQLWSTTGYPKDWYKVQEFTLAG